MQDAIDSLEISTPLVPTWLPEGYISKDLQVLDTPRVLNISAVYAENGSELVIKIRQTIGVQAPKV